MDVSYAWRDSGSESNTYLLFIEAYNLFLLVTVSLCTLYCVTLEN